MDILVIILLLSIPFIVSYKIYEPRIDIVLQPKKRVILLWYNLFIDGYPTGKRAYKKLFTLQFFTIVITVYKYKINNL